MIFIVGVGLTFPEGAGATARVLAYAKGLVAAGEEVKVVCLKATVRQGEDSWRGEHAGIAFEYAPGTSRRGSTFLRRRLLEVKGAARYWRILSAEPRGRPRGVILLSGSPTWSLLTVAFCRALRASCVLEKSEFPFVYERETLFRRSYARLYTRAIYPLFDGFIVISTLLERYFEKAKAKRARVIRIPILVDPDAFAFPDRPWGGGIQKMVFVGHLDHSGEVETLLESFAAIAYDYPRWRLQIIGASARGREAALLASAERLGIRDRVTMSGALDRERLVDQMRSASAFALPRRDALFSQAGFATKLGEYLASGRPVIASATGDVGLYLRDGVDAFLVENCTVASFSSKFREVLADEEKAVEVGRRGRETAIRCFNMNDAGRRLVAFFDSLATP